MGGPLQKSPNHLSLHKNLQHLGSLSSLLISRITEDQRHLSVSARGKGRDKLPAASSSPLTESIPPRAVGTRPGGRSIPPFSPRVVRFYSHRLGASAPSPRVAATYFRPRLGIAARPPPTPARWHSRFRAPEAGSQGSPVLPLLRTPPSPPCRSRRPPWARASASSRAAPSPLPHPGRGRASGGDVKGRAVAAPPRALVKKKKKRGSET